MMVRVLLVGICQVDSTGEQLAKACLPQSGISRHGAGIKMMCWGRWKRFCFLDFAAALD